MKTVGIITIHHSTNYGASLQAFALYQFLKNVGFDTKVIDLYRPVYDGYIPSKRFIPYLTRKKTLKEIIKDKVKRWLIKENNDFTEPYKLAMAKFAEFNSMVELTNPYPSIDQLYNNPPIFDTYVTGSDQLWNPNQPFCLEPYFLTFAPKGKKRISYAASIGITSLPEKVKKDFINWLSGYDAITVREQKAKVLLDSFVCKDVMQVPDPTFLLTREQWNSYAALPNTNESYILVFTLLADLGLLNLADKMAKANNCKLIIFGHFRRSYPDSIKCEVLRDAGPREFLGYIQKAKCVITDSFHGSVFSILLGARNFYSYIPSTNTTTIDKGSRITDLLETFSLNDHLLYSPDGIDLNRAYNNIVDCERIDKILYQERQRGQQFLLQNL